MVKTELLYLFKRRIHEQYRRLQDKQQQIETARLREEQFRAARGAALNHSSHEIRAPLSPTGPQGAGAGIGLVPDGLSPLNRAERIQQLRAEHQRRHRERQGQYPLDAQEEAYERQLQEYEKQVRLDVLDFLAMLYISEHFSHFWNVS